MNDRIKGVHLLMRYGRCQGLLILVLDAIHLVFEAIVYVFQNYYLASARFDL